MTGGPFAIQEIPFSRRGAWFDISPVIAEKTYAEDLHLVSHQTGMHAVLRFETRHGGVRVASDVIATPAKLTWEHAAGAVELVYQDEDTVRLRGTGLGLRVAAAADVLTPFGGSYFFQEPAGGAYVFTSYETGRRYRITVLTGEPAGAAGQELLGGGDRYVDLPEGTSWEIALEEYTTARGPYRVAGAFDEVAETAQTVFDRFVEAVAPWRSPDTPAAALAAYVVWSATVAPAGFLGRPAVLMSKHWMDKVWSWDHCFNAIALAAGEPDLAWDQFMLPFDHQDPTGALPDSVAHSEVLYNFVKPPIHGWAFSHLRRLLPRPLTRGQLLEAYDRMSRWARFWLEQRRVPGEELPYYQHGNDSGWDNATTFDDGRLVQTADLAAFLVAHLTVLAGMAAELDDEPGAARWRDTAHAVRDAMIDQLWDGTRFVARRPGGAGTSASGSLLGLMPLTLGADLPEDIRDPLVEALRTHLTANGLATEPVSSACYEPDGYWRGPIWAPPTALLEDGLRRAGQTGLADDISDRFRALCERSGFAENFDAETGAGLRDRSYTWTASSYLILAEAYERRRRAAGQPPAGPGVVSSRTT